MRLCVQTLVLLLAMAASPALGSPVSCPEPPSDRDEFTHAEVIAFVDSTTSLPPELRNQTLETCHRLRWRHFNWMQTQILLHSLAELPERSRWSPVHVRSRMSREYFLRHLDEMTVYTAVEVAAYQELGLGKNELLAGFFDHWLGGLLWLDVKHLIAALSEEEGDQWGAPFATVPLRDRMTEQFLALVPDLYVPLEEAIEAASLQSDPLNTNRLVEAYFLAMKSELSERDVRKLVAALREGDRNSPYSREATERRIREAWKG